MKRFLAIGVIPTILVLSGVTLGLGWIGPCMTLVPGFGALDGWVRLFAPDEFTEPKTYSILTGIVALWDEKHAGIAILLAGFSIAFPAVKLAVMGYGHAAVVAGKQTGTAWWLAHHAGKFSMLDVLVVAVLVLAVKGMPGDSDVVVGWGLWSFAVSVGLSMFAAIGIAWVEHRDAPSTPGTNSSEPEPPSEPNDEAGDHSG
ncbi:MAG: paraquat-inducible protein A [Planctomycetota bacterium]